MSIIHTSMGGPIYRLDAPKRTYFFEWHPHCGPMLLRKDLEPAKRYSPTAMDEIQKWIDQGKKHRKREVAQHGTKIRICIYKP